MKTLKIYGTLTLIAAMLLLMQCRKADTGIDNNPTNMVTFEIGADYIFVGCPITFTNTTQNVSSFEWDFGDGTGSVEENPIKSYSISGEYTVSLSVTIDGDQQRKEEDIMVGEVDKFVRVHPTPMGVEFLNTAVQTDSNSYIAAGRRLAKAYYAEVNLDADFGNPISEETTPENGELKAITPAGDGGYLIVGYKTDASSSRDNIYMVKRRGVQQWTGLVFNENPEYANSATLLPNGRFLLTGYERLPGGSENLTLRIISSSGFADAFSKRTFGPEDQYRGHQIIPSADGGYIIVGAKLEPTFFLSGGFIKKVDSQFNHVWERSINNIELKCVAETPDGNYIIGGIRNGATSLGGFAYLAKVGPNQDLSSPIWEKDFSFSNIGSSIEDIISVNDEYYAVTGFTNEDYIFETSATLLMINKDGADYRPRKRYNFSSNFATAVAPTNDCGHLIVGGSGAHMIIKTDAEGNAM